MKNFFQSDWIQDDRKTDHTTVIDHPLKGIPEFIEIFFSPDKEAIYHVSFKGSGEGRNPHSISVDKDSINLHIWKGTYLFAFWHPQERWKHFDSGYWRVNVLNKVDE